MIATLLPSPTLLSLFEDLRRSILDATGAGRKSAIEAFAARAPRQSGAEIAKAIGRIAIKSVVPLVLRDALARRRAAVEAVDQDGVRRDERVTHQPIAVEAPLPLISEEMIWARATQPLVDAQASANAAFKLHAEAGAHIDAATYALEGLLGDLKAVMPGISVRSAKLHKVDFRTSRDQAPAAPTVVPVVPLRTVRAA